MALTIELERKDRWGKLKVATYKITDSDGGGGSLAVGDFFNHIDNVIINDITTAAAVTATWTDGSETITIGSEGSAADVYKVTVIGT